ncbi:hypothetical protein JTB14_006739 [Gonioctena quinquepunctata]|nr:hypothetical protein JTB14_006739 [Gonioctena quinquepunctata]
MKTLKKREVTWEPRKSEAPIHLQKMPKGGTHSPNCKQPQDAQGHYTDRCTKSTETPANCANCNKNHPANYKGCEANLLALALAEKQTPTHPRAKRGDEEEEWKL